MFHTLLGVFKIEEVPSPKFQAELVLTGTDMLEKLAVEPMQNTIAPENQSENFLLVRN